MYKDEEKKFDVRVVKRYIEEGILTQEEYEAYLRNLPDVSSKVDEEYHFTFSPVSKRDEDKPTSSSSEENPPSQENEGEG
jgi:hypothetical protein